LKDEIVILASYNNLKDLAIFLRVNKIKCPVYILDHEQLRICDNFSNSPFYFVMDKDLNISDIYFPQSNDSIMNQMYIKNEINKIHNFSNY